MPPKDKRTLGLSSKFSGKPSGGPSDEQRREECLAVHSQMLGHILLIPGTLTQFLETRQRKGHPLPKTHSATTANTVPGKVGECVPVSTSASLKFSTQPIFIKCLMLLRHFTRHKTGHNRDPVRLKLKFLLESLANLPAEMGWCLGCANLE